MKAVQNRGEEKVVPAKGVGFVRIQGITTNGGIGWRITSPWGEVVTHYDESYAAERIFMWKNGRPRLSDEAIEIDKIADTLP